MSAYAIRPAAPADHAAMDRLCTAAVRGQCARVYEDEVIEAWVGAADPQRFERESAKGTQWYVAEYRGAIVAYGGINVPQAHIDGLFVAPDHANDGLGEQLLAFLMRQARQHALPSVSVESPLDAARFYHRHGFRSYEQRIVSLARGLQLEAVLMRRTAGAQST